MPPYRTLGVAPGEAVDSFVNPAVFFSPLLAGFGEACGYVRSEVRDPGVR